VNKSQLEQISQLETRLSEVTKKYEEYKKSYYKTRDERDKLRAEYGVKDEQKVEASDVAQKYESLKSKYRVSIVIFDGDSLWRNCRRHKKKGLLLLRSR
jgi:chromosome segregation ATPase